MYGRFRSIRKTLDYTFHKKYPIDRQILQDNIVTKFLDNRPCTLRNPSLILTAGAMGAGKSHVIRYCLGNRYDKFVVADVDRIKYHLPEMQNLMENDPYQVGKMLHSEACTIHEILFKEAISRKCDVIIDGSLRNADFFKKFLPNVRNTHTVTIVHVVASLKTCLDRAQKRSKETGRVVPRESIELSITECPKSVKELSPLADNVININNDGDGGGITDFICF